MVNEVPMNSPRAIAERIMTAQASTHFSLHSAIVTAIEAERGAKAAADLERWHEDMRAAMSGFCASGSKWSPRDAMREAVLVADAMTIERRKRDDIGHERFIGLGIAGWPGVLVPAKAKANGGIA